MTNELPESVEVDHRPVLMRVDSNRAIGTGHLHRCLNLALELRARGMRPCFAIGSTDQSSKETLRSAGFEWIELDDHVRSLSDGNDRLRTPEEEILADAAATSRAAAAQDCGLIVVDHYSIDDRWAELVRNSGRRRVLVIDDLRRSWSSVDVLVDGSLNDAPASQATGGHVRCGGPSFAILHPLYKSIRFVPRRENESPRVLVFFGGVDSPNMTSTALQSISSSSLAAKSLKVIVGSSNPHRDVLMRSHADQGIVWLPPAESMYAHLMETDVAVGAAGTTTWERLCAGIPSVVVSIADNQRENGESLQVAGCHLYLGSSESLADDDIGRAVDRILTDEVLRARLSLAGMTMVDGFGASRVCEALVPSSLDSLVLRSVRPDDCMTFFRWANDPETRRASKNQGVIEWSEHREWFDTSLHSDSTHMYVAELHGMPVGQIRFNRFEGTFLLSYSVDPTQRGRGMGHRIVREGLRVLQEHGPQSVRAEVKTSNIASLSIFRAAGFEEAPPDSAGVVRFVLKCDRG